MRFPFIAFSAFLFPRSTKFTNKHIDLKLHEFGNEAWDRIQPLLLCVAILNQDVFPLNITEIAQTLPECLDPRPGSVGITT